MVPEQMLCIVAPAAELTRTGSLPTALSTATCTALDRLFERVGRVHFASLMLLPPRPGEPGPAPSALVLELAIDDDLPPNELVNLLLEHGLDTLWPLYRAFWPGGTQTSPLHRRDWLRDFLTRHVSRADGGYIGARDRSVGQIQAEARLFAAARRQLYQRPIGEDEDRRSLARRIADWAADKHEFQWAAEPAPRSFWRARWMTPPVRLLLVLATLGWGIAGVAVALVLLAVLAFVGVLALLLLLSVTDLATLLDSTSIFGAYAGSSWRAVAAVFVCAALFVAAIWIAVSGARTLTFAALLLLVFGVAMIVAVFGTYLAFGALGWPFPEFVGALGVLVRAGLLVVAWVVLAWALMAGAFALAVAAVPPFLGLPAVVAGAFALVLGAFGLAHLLLALLLASLGSGGVDPWAVGGLSFLLALPVLARGLPLRVAIVAAALSAAFIATTAVFVGGLALAVPSLAHPAALGLTPLEGFALLVLLVFSMIAFLLSRWLRLPPFAERSIAKRLDRLKVYEADRLPAAGQVHPTIEACEAELAAGGRVSHMISLTEVRSPVWLNRLALWALLRLVTHLGHSVFVDGKLGTAEGIRFGHWHLIDGGRRLLFCSNFDGSFGGYLDEFINGASEGINLFWRWTTLPKRAAAVDGQPDVKWPRVYPPTKLLVYRGCKYELLFKTFARDSMLPHLYRFEAYSSSARDVERASRLRAALFGERNHVNDDAILRALES